VGKTRREVLGVKGLRPLKNGRDEKNKQDDFHRPHMQGTGEP